MLLEDLYMYLVPNPDPDHMEGILFKLKVD